jgi:hypothetical protein
VVEEYCFLSVKVLESSVARFIASEKVPSTLVVRAMPVATSGGETEPETGGFPYGLGDPPDCQFYGEGYTVELAADPTHRRRILFGELEVWQPGAGAIREEPHGLVAGKAFGGRDLAPSSDAR